ncbi:MAG: DUF3418 domain-containing protein [Buchananella hordeovulneris]|nr:DUF3418 domain-containing protein [Buchananella hordeovulneris]
MTAGSRAGRASSGRGFSAEQLQARRAAVPTLTYPDLPVSARREEILAAIRDHQVVVVAGATGSGKTTQLPKMCVELGRGVAGLIGHTQPRRIAARSVAERLAFELGVEVGGVVGYQVRFTDETAPTTLVKLMTDGILLAEVQRDPLLRHYDTVIVDEAHERSLNIDFILGYLARLLPLRPDLKVIITSATIDSARFAAHFERFASTPVPVIEVSGRTFPVEIRYRPLVPQRDLADDAPPPAPAAPPPPVAAKPAAAPGAKAAPLKAAQPKTAPSQPAQPKPTEAKPAEERALRRAELETAAFAAALQASLRRRPGITQIAGISQPTQLPGSAPTQPPAQGAGEGTGEATDRQPEQAGAPQRPAPERPLAASAAKPVVALPQSEPARAAAPPASSSSAAASQSLPSLPQQPTGAPPRAPEPAPHPAEPTQPLDLLFEGDEVFPTEEIDQVAGICAAVDELLAESERLPADGTGRDILVFLAGERDIRDTHAALIEHLGRRYVADPKARGHRPDGVEILPLFARLTTAEQHRVFEPHALQRIVLATNVAETSLTVPGIRYVIDPGLARISRYSNRTKVQRLPIEPVSRASSDQRAGRCGRVAEGIAIRLFSKADLAGREEFTEPEILRTSLASVILQMTALGLGRVEEFPFVDPPEARAVRDGVTLLTEIGAVTQENGDIALTAIGRRLAALPIDPRLARMLIAADEAGCAAEVLVIVAALSMQDVRERPAEKAAAADEAHRRFAHPTSDFLTYVTLWRYIRTQRRELSGSAFRRMCRTEFLHYLRVREWQDLVQQLRQLARPLGLKLHPIALPDTEDLVAAALTEGGAALGGGTGTSSAVAAACVAFTSSGRSADESAVHRALLTGLLSNVGAWDERKKEYGGARGTRFTIWPGSGLVKAKRTPAWVMTAELIETSRLFARTVARIEPGWVEELAGHLVTRSYNEPHWSKRHGAAMINEKVQLYGLTLTAAREVLLGRLGDTPVGDVSARELAREMFIRHALVEGQWHARHAFVKENERRVAAAHEVERRTRTHGLVADAEVRVAFFAARLPAHITSAAAFDKWWKKTRQAEPDLLTYPVELLRPRGAGAEGFPDHWPQDDARLELRYEFTPGRSDDGVTAVIPVDLLASIRPESFDWMVPGVLDELVLATLRALPKQIRRQLVPAPDVAREVVEILRGLHPLVADVAASRPDSEAAASGEQAAGAGAKEGVGGQAQDAAAAEETGEDTAGEKSGANSGSKALPRTLVPGSSMRDAWALLRAQAEEREAARVAQRAGVRADRETNKPARSDGSFRTAFTRAVESVRGVVIPVEAWEGLQLPDHLRMTFRVVSGRGAVLGEGKHLGELQRDLEPKAKDAVRGVVRGALAMALEEARATTEATPRSKRRGANAAPAQREKAKQPGQRAPKPGDQRAAATPGQPQAGAPTNAAGAAGKGNEAGGGNVGGALSAIQAAALEASDLRDFPAQAIAQSVEVQAGGKVVRAYPALVAPAAPQARADLKLMTTAAAAAAEHPRGVRALLLQKVALSEARVTSRWTGTEALALAASPYKSTAALVADAQWAATALVLVEWARSTGQSVQVRHPAQFVALLAYANQHFEDAVYRVLRWCAAALTESRAVDKALSKGTSLALVGVAAKMRARLAALLFDGFLGATPIENLGHLPRYVKALGIRFARAATDPRGDEAASRVIETLEAELAAALEAAQGAGSAGQAANVGIEEVAWLLEELRVSLFAQSLGTPVKVSEKRVRAALQAATKLR